jgi:hypothetical protein
MALNSSFSCSGIKLCPATQGVIHIVYSHFSDDTLIGGAGDDTLTGAGRRDIFDYGFENAGNDTITDFTLGNTKTNTNADIIDLFNGCTKIKCDCIGSSICTTTACNY